MLRLITILALLCAPVGAFPPWHHFVNRDTPAADADAQIIEVVRAAYYNVHGEDDSFSPSFVSVSSSSDRFSLAPLLGTMLQRKRTAEWLSTDKRAARVALAAHYGW